MENDKEKPSNKRRLISIFMYPMLRIKYGSYYAFIGLCTVAVLNFALVFILLQMMNYAGDEPNMGSTISKTLMTTLKYNQWIIITTIVILLILFLSFAFILANRIAGPMLPLIRHIDELKAGNYSHRTRLRKNDELKPLMKSLNELSEVLEEKHK